MILFTKLKKLFSKDLDNFPIRKFQLISIINKNPNNLKKITKIVHPIVRKEMKLFLKKNQNKKAVVLDIPLFLENNLDRKNDILVFIDPDKKKAILRLKRRTNFNKRNFKLFCEKGFTRADITKYCDPNHLTNLSLHH